MKRINCILLVDDNETDNEFHINRILKSGVCDLVKTAEDGEKGLAYLKKAGSGENRLEYLIPDLIFLDVNMPKVNGFEFLEEYKNIPSGNKAKTVIVMLSTYLNSDDKIKAMNYIDVGGFENKPLTIEAIQDIVEKYFP